MKVYFVASSTGIKKYLKQYRLIIKIVRQLGHQVIDDWVEKEVAAQKKETPRLKSLRESIFQRSVKAMMTSDAVIAEISVPAGSVGYQIAFALDHDIPVLCLCLKDREKYIPSMIKTNPSQNLIIRLYTQSSLLKTLTDYFQSLPKTQVKFNLYISREMKRYLNWKSKITRIPKSEIVRRLIENNMLLDSEYKKAKPNEVR